MRVLCPGSVAELRDMLRWAVLEQDGPVAVRYPRGGDRGYSDSGWDGKKQICTHREGTDVVLVVYGTMVQNALDAAQLLEQRGVHASVLRLLSVSPLPTKELADMLPENTPVVVIEEACTGSGIQEALAWELAQCKPSCWVKGMDLGKQFVPHGSLNMLYKHCGLDANAVADYVQEVLNS